MTFAVGIFIGALGTLVIIAAALALFLRSEQEDE